jgi:glycosyltransferase involved in cell wall biosynthesis
MADFKETEVYLSSLDLSVCLLAYNEEGCLDQFLEELVHGLLATQWQWEIVVVDDASEDGTAMIVNAWASRDNRIRTVRHAHNQGYAFATRTAMRSARAHKIVIMDGDGQHDFQQVKTVYELLCEPMVDIVFPVRISRSESLQRRVASSVLRIQCRFLLSFPLPDVNGGIKGLSRSAAQQIEIRERANLVNPELWARSCALGLTYAVAKVPQLPRIDDKPSSTFRNPARQLIFVTKYVWRLRPALRA